MSEVINANPKILSIQDLPTRVVFLPSSSLSTPPCALDAVLPTHSANLYSTLLLDDLSDPEADDFSDSDTSDSDPSSLDALDEQEIYDLISSISDPEHPLTLGQLAVVNKPDIHILPGGTSSITRVLVEITPTITHCSLATLIGLGIRVRLERALPPRYRVEIRVKKGTHQSESQVNKQLNDKERVAAACENQQLLGVLSTMLATCR
ncbi:uncharacterized protein V1518DRAFT_423424 [Limtongia smithiae]|uniref:uncharacterized protein n=1 Tax=Limtongia smithiae TaxID=1125753 RepID=UPI0034CDB7CF